MNRLGLEKFIEFCCFSSTREEKIIMRYQNFQSGLSMFERPLAFCVVLILSVTPTACATAGDTTASKPAAITMGCRVRLIEKCADASALTRFVFTTFPPEGVDVFVRKTPLS